MEEEKAAAFYDELTRKGEGAARFKQGLGFTSGADVVPARGSAIASSSSSFLNQFVKASSNPNSTEKLEKDSEIRSIRDKLKKKPEDQQQARVLDRGYRDSSERRRYRSRESDERDKSRRRRSRSRSTERRSRYGDRETRRRSRSRSSSPRRERRRNEDDRRGRRREEVKEHPNRKKIDYSRLIKGYDEMVYCDLTFLQLLCNLNSSGEFAI